MGLSDHAKDQKLKHRLLGERKEDECELALAENNLYAMPNDQREKIFIDLENSLIDSLGGEAAWNALDPLVQQKHMEEGIENVLKGMAAKKTWTRALAITPR